MMNRWSAEARAASAAARLEKYGPMMGLRPWGDTARSAAAASRAARAAQAGGMTASEATEFALDARFGTGYLSDGSGGIDVTLGLGRARSSGSYSGDRRIPVMSDATPFEDRKAKYEAAFREWWKGVQATGQNIAAFHAFVAAFGGAAAGAMGAYRQATGEMPVAGVSRAFGRTGGYLSGKTPMYDESGVLAGWAKPGAARYGRTSRPVGRQPLSKAANLRFDLGRAKIVDPKTGKTVGRAAYSSDGDWPIPSRDMRGVQKAYDMGVRAFGDGTSLEQALRETGIIAGSEEAYMFQKGWQDAPAVTEAVERYEPYPVSISPETSDSLLADYGPQKVYDYGVSAYRDGMSLEEALHEAGVQPGTDAAFSVEKGYNDAVAIPDTEEDDGAPVAEESLGEEYERYLDEVNAARDSEMAAKGLDPLGFPLSGGGYDPIADAEYEGRQAFLDGEDLREAVEEREIDLDTDSGMAFVQSFRSAKREASRTGRALMEQARRAGGYDPISEREAEGREAFLNGESLQEAFEYRELDPDNDADMAFVLGYKDASRAGAVREPALSPANAPRRSDRAAEDAYNEMALMREPLYDKGRFGERVDQYKKARGLQAAFDGLGPRVGGAEASNSARESLSAAFEAVARGEDASPAIAQAQAAVSELKGMPVFTPKAGVQVDMSKVRPYVMDLSGGGNFDDASETFPPGAGTADFITPAQREAARELGVLEGQWGVNSMVERMVPPQLLDEYEAGLAEGRKDPSEKSSAMPADRAAVVRAARAYLDGRIGDSEEEGSDVPDHLSDRWNVQDYSSADEWASRNKKEVVPAQADERGQYADAALVKAGLDWLGNAVADGDTAAADAAVAYLDDLLGTVRAGKDKPAARAADDGDGDEGDDAADRVEFDEDGEEVEGERFFEDSYADPNISMPWEYEGNSSFRKWFPGVRNRSAVAKRLLAIDKYRERGLENRWSTAARAASAAVRLAKYGAMMGLRPWGAGARSAAAAARAAKRGESGGGGTIWTGGTRDFDESTGTYRSYRTEGSAGDDGAVMGLKQWGAGARSAAAAARAAKRGESGGTIWTGGTRDFDERTGTRRSYRIEGFGGEVGKAKVGSGGGRPDTPGNQWLEIPENQLREVDFAEAVEAYGEGGFDALDDAQRKVLFEDIKERSESGGSLTRADERFLSDFEEFLDEQIKEMIPTAGDERDMGGGHGYKRERGADGSKGGEDFLGDGAFRKTGGESPYVRAKGQVGEGGLGDDVLLAAAGQAPAHWSSAAQRNYKERQEKRAREQRRQNKLDADKRRLAEEREERRQERGKSLSAVRSETGDSTLPRSWDARVPVGSVTGFKVPVRDKATYSGEGFFRDGQGQPVRMSKGYRESSDDAVFIGGRWYDKKTGKTIKTGKSL